MKYDIFISYRREDSSGRSNAPTARQFKLAFEAPPYNYKVFFDYSECTDDYFTDTILSAIRTCDYFVLVLTKDSLARCSSEGDWVRREIEEAIVSKKKIVPITPDKECESFPQELPDSLRKAFDGLQITTIYTDSMFESGIEYLVKNRFHNPKIDCPEGAIKGVFSVSPTKKVYFSKGNLQYQASTGMWRFAENQYDIVGQDNEKISPNNDGWIDLFGWGTWGPGNNPVNTSTNCLDYLDFEFQSRFLGSYKNVINGGKDAPWTLLSDEEWHYVFYRRRLTNDFSFAYAVINDVNGIVLLPDTWNEIFSSLKKNPNRAGIKPEINYIYNTLWNRIEDAGAVFLPAAGGRYGTEIWHARINGYYWTKEKKGDTGEAYTIVIEEGDVHTNVISFLIFNGQSVRFVCPVGTGLL